MQAGEELAPSQGMGSDGLFGWEPQREGNDREKVGAEGRTAQNTARREGQTLKPQMAHSRTGKLRSSFCRNRLACRGVPVDPADR